MFSPEPEHERAAHQAQEPTPNPQLRQLALQGAAAFVVLSLAWPYYLIRNLPLPWAETCLAIGGSALVLSSLTNQDWWWRVIHAVFAPSAWWISTLAIDPAWFLLAFVGLLLVYRGAVSGQIPLYLSNRSTTLALAALIPDATNNSFADLGCGIGSALCPLAKARPRARFTGIENAHATWLVAYLRTLGQGNCTVRLGSFWQENLASYDVVYAFLSPSPMPALWAKIEQEMRPGSLFVSNTFAVPGVSPCSVVEVGDRRRTQLYCYRR